MNRRVDAPVAAYVLRWMIPVAAVLVAVVAPSPARAGGPDCMAQVSQDHGRAVDQPRAATDGATVVYLDRDGGRATAGNEDSSVNRSSVLWMQGVEQVNVPAWSRSDAEWDDLVGCVADRFADFDVRITDERPTSGNYVMAMVGGQPSMLGLGRSVGGIAPYNSKVIDNAVVYIFERNVDGARQQCEATAHEIGHALGLDHSSLCSDIMSYDQCGAKEFRDEAAVCGEGSERACSDGSATQNSYAMLVHNVGLRRRSPLPEPPRVAPRPDPEPPRIATRPAPPPRHPISRRGRPAVRGPGQSTRLPARRGVATVPKVQISQAARSQRGNSRYLVSLRARDPDGIAKVELLWSDGRFAYRLRCGDSSGVLPVRCARRGDTYTFALDVGRGDRSFAVRVTDGAGRTATTKPRGVRLY